MPGDSFPPEPEAPAEAEAEPQGGGIPFLALAFGALALALAAVMISQIAPLLAGLLNPVEPPFYSPATLVETQTLADDRTEWRLTSFDDGCAIMAWYRAAGASCQVDPSAACAAEYPAQRTGEYNVGHCTGQTPFGEFVSRWEVFINEGYNTATGSTLIRVIRGIDWMN